MLALTQLSRTNLQGLWPGQPSCTNARVTTHILEAPGVVALPLAMGCFRGLDGVHGRALVPCTFCEIGATGESIALHAASQDFQNRTVPDV